MRPLLRTWLDESPTFQIELLFFPQEFLRAGHGFLFGQRSAGRLFGKNMPGRMQRPVRPQDHRELLRLAVPEITYAPEGAWNARVINSVRSGNPNSLAQIFVHKRVGDVGEDRSVVVRIGIKAALAQELIGPHAGSARVDGEFQVLANGLRI